MHAINHLVLQPGSYSPDPSAILHDSTYPGVLGQDTEPTVAPDGKLAHCMAALLPLVCECVNEKQYKRLRN